MKKILKIKAENLVKLKKIAKELPRKNYVRENLNNFRILKNGEKCRVLATNGFIAHDFDLDEILEKEELHLPFSIFKNLNEKENIDIFEEENGALFAKNSFSEIKINKNGECPQIEKISDPFFEKDADFIIKINPKMLQQFIFSGQEILLAIKKGLHCALVIDPKTKQKIGISMIE